MNAVYVSEGSLLSSFSVLLPSSKSESNRVLIINALAAYQQNEKIEEASFQNLHRLSEARDTQTMCKLLVSPERMADVLDAGTTIRFLTAYFSLTQQQKILTGTPRMKQRPIGILVNALNELGANINYLEKEGFPPLEINGFQQKNNHLSIQADISSQYISALLMVAPLMEGGLKLELEGKISSLPYIQMTLEQMGLFGIQHQWDGNSIHIEKQLYQKTAFTVESDWSASSYWFTIAALSESSEIFLEGLRENSFQGDQRIVELGALLGVECSPKDNGMLLRKKTIVLPDALKIDFSDCPDLAPTVLVMAAALKVDLEIKGLESLRIKETDRIEALQIELGKTSAALIEIDKNNWQLFSKGFDLKENTFFHSYEDHRMAMAFAPLGLLKPIRIENPIVVAKSYPQFWKDLKKSGFEISF